MKSPEYVIQVLGCLLLWIHPNHMVHHLQVFQVFSFPF